MNSESVKILMVQMIATVAVILINSGIVYSYYQLVLVNHLTDIMHFKFKLTDFMFFLLSFQLILMNMGIPFHNYNIEEEFAPQLHDELSDITGHIMTSAIFTASLIVAMNYIRM